MARRPASDPTMATGGPLGPVQLHHLLGVNGQEPGQPSAGAASALDRPHPLPMMLVGDFSSCW
jgi:hypothetical protein